MDLQHSVMCRVCLRSDPVARLSLFECTIVGRPAAEALAIVGGIPPVLAGDRLPQLCCSDCLQQLEAAFNLREMVRESNRKLGEMLAGVDNEKVVVKQEVDDVAAEELAVAGTSGTTIVGNYEITKIEMQSDEYGSNSCSSTAVRSEPMENEDLSDEDDSPIKEEITIEEPRIQDPDVDQESSCDAEDVNRRSFFEELPVKPTVCCGCRLTCSSLEELQVHYQSVHAPMRTPQDNIKKGMQECAQCYKIIRTKNGHRPRNLRCKICGEMFTKWYGATLHYKSKHAPGKTPKPKICCGCQERFQTFADLKTHAQLTHLPNRLPPDEKRPFVCEICYKNYPDHNGLHQHQRRLAQESKPHQCNQCERSFFFLNALRDHELSHTAQERTLPCPKCPASFLTQHSLRKHIARHEMPPDKFQCATCQKSFRSQKALREHGYVHTGERPHKCPQCEASFARYDCYRAHVRNMHNEEGRGGLHECEVCGKTFRKTGNLLRHMREMHERKSKPYACELCAESFLRSQGLENHVRKVHPEEGVTGKM